MKLTGKEILSLSALVADRLTKDLDTKELLCLKLFIGQLNYDICTLYSAKMLEKDQKSTKN